MNLLKRIPIHYKGELHDVRLINFTVPMEEVKGKVPAKIKIRDFNGRAMISMVDVTLKRMRPFFMPEVASFTYRHIAFRLLVDDSELNDGVSKGIYFFQSFTDKPLIVAGGTLFTDYNLGLATIKEANHEVVVSKKDRYVKYCLDHAQPKGNEGLKGIIGAIDRAYSDRSNMRYMTLIQREKWPIQEVNCSGFETTFFREAWFEGAYRVFETIYYDWLPPKAIGDEKDHRSRW